MTPGREPIRLGEPVANAGFWDPNPLFLAPRTSIELQSDRDSQHSNQPTHQSHPSVELVKHLHPSPHRQAPSHMQYRNWSKCRGSTTRGKRTPSPKARALGRKREQNDTKSQRPGWPGVKQCLLDSQSLHCLWQALPTTSTTNTPARSRRRDQESPLQERSDRQLMALRGGRTRIL